MKRLICLFIWLLSLSCNNNDKSQIFSSGEKTVEVKGYIVSKDSSIESNTITIDSSKLIIIPVGSPKIILSNSNIHPSGTPKIIFFDKNRLHKITPGTDTFEIPSAVPAIGKATYCGLPEIIIAKDAAAKDINPANFSYYKTLQGLAHNTVRSMLQDKSGNIWFGTYGGACKYNGKTFTNFTIKEGLASNFVNTILEDKNGNIWFGTNGGGISCYDGKSFINFTEKEGLANNTIYSISQDKKGNIWFGTNGGGISCFTENKFINYTTKNGLTNNIVWSIINDRNGNIWFGTEGGISCYNGNYFTNYTEKEGLPSNIVYSMLETKNGNIWLGTWNGISLFNGKFFSNYSEKNGLPSNFIYSALEDNRGNVWFGTSRGICCYDGTSFKNYTDKEGLSSNFINAILEDKSGTMWFGTDGGGVCRYEGKTFVNYSDEEGLSNKTIWSICKDKNKNIWFGTNRGISCYDYNSFYNYESQEGFINDYVYSVLEDKKGNIWFGTNGGVCCFDGNAPRSVKKIENIDGKNQKDVQEKNKNSTNHFTYFTDKVGLPDNSVYALYEDKKGRLWFGTGDGACCYDGKSLTNFTKKEGLPNNLVFSISEDKFGNIWFGTDGGACCYDGKSLIQYTEKEGFLSNIVYSIFKDKDEILWFGTGGGICRFDGKYFMNFTDKDGLGNNAVVNILQDKDGNIWFGTRNGLSRVEQKKLKLLFQRNNNFNPIKEAFFYNYEYNDGFLGLNCRRNSVLQDDKGKIWWGAGVLTSYDPNGETIDTTAPIVNLTSVKLFGEEISWKSLKNTDPKKNTIKDTLLSNGILLKNIQFDSLTKWYNLPEHLSLPYNNNNLTFNFIGIHIQSRNHIKYQYKLEGMDPDWSSITERTEAPYGNLPTGDYVFKIKAMNQSGIWSEALEFKFEVRPPWWQTWWFRGLGILLIIGSIALYIKWRERTLKERQKQLELKIDEATIEIRTQKTVVEEQKQLIEERHKEITDSINYAERIQHSFLATQEHLNKNLPEYFVFFKPKGIVSGDFYWSASLNNGNFLLAIADSTGHGVPGAIMSLLNITSLEKAIETESEPDKILNVTRNIIIERLKKDGSPEGGKDGMDGSLLNFDFKNKTLFCASANNPVWIIRNNELIEIKGDRFPIGKHEKDTIPFTLHKIEIQKGDMIYSFTDGFQDQFGGVKGKKFKHKQLQNLLKSLANKPMPDQKQEIENAFNNWKGNLEQVDDVTIVGIRM